MTKIKGSNVVRQLVDSIIARHIGSDDYFCDNIFTEDDTTGESESKMEFQDRSEDVFFLKLRFGYKDGEFYIVQDIYDGGYKEICHYKGTDVGFFKEKGIELVDNVTDDFMRYISGKLYYIKEDLESLGFKRYFDDDSVTVKYAIGLSGYDNVVIYDNGGEIYLYFYYKNFKVDLDLSKDDWKERLIYILNNLDEYKSVFADISKTLRRDLEKRLSEQFKFGIEDIINRT